MNSSNYSLTVRAGKIRLFGGIAKSLTVGKIVFKLFLFIYLFSETKIILEKNPPLSKLAYYNARFVALRFE